MLMKKLYLTFLMLFGLSAMALAQMKVSGKISDANNEPLVGASIVEKGTNNGITSDIDGNFTITVKEGATLQVSMVGFETQSIAVGKESTINVTLTEGSNLSEVVVTAYGITKEQKTLSYATHQLDTRTFSQARELNVANSLSGRVPGLDVTRAASGVGGATRVVLRGDRSINGNNQALIVIDGVPMDNTLLGVGNANGGREVSDGFSSINPDDIENMNVLRGAAATALYGSRASNGAILITTKKGAARKGIGVSINSSFQAEQIMVLQDFQNEYAQGSAGVYNRASEFSWGPKMGSTVAAWGPNPSAVGATYTTAANPNMYQDFFATGSQLSNSIALTGGNDKMQTYFSYTNVGATGVIDNNKLKRHNFNLRLNNQLSDKLSLDTKITYLNETIENRQQTGEAYANVQRHILRMPRNIPLAQAQNFEYTDISTGKNLQNFWNPGSNGGQNPYWIKNRVSALDNRDRITGFSSLTYKFTPAISVMARAGLDQYVDKFEGKWFTNTYTIADFGDYQTSWRQVRELNLDLLGFYRKQLTENFAVDATVGGSINKYSQLSQATNNNGLNRDNLFIPGNARNSVTSRGVYETEKQGVFATADLTFKNAITLNLTARNDWASTLPVDNQSYFYSGVGVSAVLSELVKMPEAISFAKVRGSYAGTGAEGFNSAYLLTQTYSFIAGGPNGYIVRDATKPFENLKPEITTALEFGLEMKFLKNRIGFDLGWYNSDSKDQLFRVAIPGSSGWTSEFINAGLVNNKGVELTLNVTPIKMADFRWDASVIYATNKNKLVELTKDLKVLNQASDFMNFSRATEGRPLGDIYSRGFVRDSATGKVLVDATGLPQITSGTTVLLGNTRPDWTGGFSSRFSYKNVFLSFLISARMGGVVSSFTNAVIYADGVTTETLAGRDGFVFDGLKAADKTPNNISTTAEKYWLRVGGRNAPAGEVFTYDASNIRLRELVLGFSLPSSISKGKFIQGASISLVGRNLFFLMNKAKGFDPELVVGSQNTTVGLESFSAPSTRTVGLNLNLTF
jgi:TonB-linked SusC/RagA family outer membrane protein